MNVIPVAEASNGPEIQFRSELLGEMSLPENVLFTFPDGLYGFEEAHRFVLVPAERDGLYWLQSVDFSALTFLVADPFHWVEGYSVELPDTELASLAPADASDVAVLVIVTLPRSADECPTANMQGPVAFNMRKRVGRQLVVQESDYDTRHPLDLGGRAGAN
jgi:flagellar assembly factor FliW